MTKPKPPQKGLRTSEMRYRRLFEAARDGILILDALTLRIIEVNPFMTELLGCSRAEFLGKDLWEIGLFTDKEASQVVFRELQETGYIRFSDLPLQTRQGELREVEFVSNVYDVGGNQVIQCNIRDITEHKRVEGILRRSQEQLAGVIGSAMDAIISVDEDQHIVLFNAAAERMFLYSSKDAIGQPVDRFIPERFRPAHREHIENFGRTHVTTRTMGNFGAILGLRADGEEFPIEASISQLECEGRKLYTVILRDITERSQAEEARHVSEERYRTLFEWAPDGIVIADSEGYYLDANASICRMLGYTRDELVGLHSSNIVTQSEVQHIGPALTAIIDKSAYQREWQFRRKDDSVFVADVIATMIPGNKLLAMVRDITERKQAEEALRESEARHRLLFESNPRPMWAYDLETLVFLAVNDAAIVHYGYSREEFLSMTLKDIRPPEEIPALLENVSRVGDGIDGTSIWKHRRKDGSIIEVEITSHELVFAGRRAELVLATDITERRQVEEAQARRASQTVLRADVNAALAETNVSLQKILELSTEAIVKHLDAAFARIWTLNTDEDVLELQASAGMYTHVDGPHARVPVGTFKIGLIAAERQPHLTNDVQNDPRVSDKEWAKREGMIAFAGYPLIVGDRLIGVMALFARHKLAEDTLDALASAADIISQTIERKRAEEALRGSEEQLRQSQKLEAVGQLAGGIAHDFNNLLTVINGYSELALKRLQPDDPMTHNLDEIKRAGSRAAMLTRQLLAFSRKQVLQPKILNLNAVISDLEKMLRRLIGEDIDLQTALEPELRRVNADPGQVAQVIMNLVVNARDAMPDGGKLIIKTENAFLTEEYARHHIAVKPGPYVRLVVSDNGSGMSDETKARLFEPFFTTKDVGKGTGLGLSTVYGIVKQSMGNVWVYSEEGLGTTFKIYLPSVDDAVDNRQPSQSSQPIAPGCGTILLVEDDKMVRGLARLALEEGGYKVLEATNGAEALLICEQYQELIHLLLTDVVMPGMSGRSLADQSKTLRPQMLVLFMSGYTQDAIVHRGVLDDGVNFIEKPFAPAVLVRKVRELLDAQRAAEK